MEFNLQEFEDIRPYNDSEVAQTIDRIVLEKGFKKTVEAMMPNADYQAVVKKLKEQKTVKDFQTTFVYDLLDAIESRTVTDFEITGLENIQKNKGYVFFSNHRDIILDSALLNVHMSKLGYETSEIAIGSNLLILPWITDLVKLNRTFVVKRGITAKELLLSSMTLSRYIHYTIEDKNTSIWIAQREGRTKDGNDKSQESVLKMFNMSIKGDIIEATKKLNIIPMTISYEYDPVDNLKIIERYKKTIDPSFKKSPIDDMFGMRDGLFCKKGRVKIHLGKCINEDLDSIDKTLNKNQIYTEIAKILDKKIYQGYKLYPINYVAADIIENSNNYSKYYTNEEKNQALDYFDYRIDEFKGDVELQKNMLHKLYAYPVFNHYGKII